MNEKKKPGRKPSGYTSTTIAFRVRVHHIDRIRQAVMDAKAVLLQEDQQRSNPLAVARGKKLPKA